MKYFSAAVKRKVLTALDNGMSVIQAKQKFGVSTFTIYKWRKEQQENGQANANQPDITINGVDGKKFFDVQVTQLEDSLRATIKQKDKQLEEKDKQLAVMRSIIIDQACQLYSLKTHA